MSMVSLRSMHNHQNGPLGSPGTPSRRQAKAGYNVWSVPVLTQVIAHAARGVQLDPKEANAAPRFAHEIRSHRLGPLAHQIGIAGFDRDFLAATLFYQRSASIAKQAIEAISLAGVPVLLLKGISLASRIYADPGERPMSDIDLLVPNSGHADASAALRRLGYWIAGPAAERGRFHHATTFKRRAAAIDLHRSIVQPLRRGSNIAGLWDRAIPAGRDFLHALIAAPIDETLLVMTHIARHELIVPAIGYVDAYRLLTALSDGDRSQLVERADRAKLRRGLDAAMTITEILANDAVCPKPLRAIHRSVIELRPLRRSTQLRRKLSLLDSPAEAVRLALGSILEKTGW